MRSVRQRWSKIRRTLVRGSSLPGRATHWSTLWISSCERSHSASCCSNCSSTWHRCTWHWCSSQSSSGSGGASGASPSSRLRIRLTGCEERRRGVCLLVEGGGRYSPFSIRTVIRSFPCVLAVVMAFVISFGTERKVGSVAFSGISISAVVFFISPLLSPVPDGCVGASGGTHHGGLRRR